MSVVALGGTTAADLEEAVQAFEAAGWRSGSELRVPGQADLVVALARPAAEQLREADGRGVKYALVHVGPDDGEPGGSYARAHHRVDRAGLPGLAIKLKSRERMIVKILAFGYKNGLPADVDWVIDARFLENPYWVEELRHLDGHDERVRAYVLEQTAAAGLLDHLEQIFTAILPDYRAQGRSEFGIAFGCTGGRHRSVVLAIELARRLALATDAAVEIGLREL